MVILSWVSFFFAVHNVLPRLKSALKLNTDLEANVSNPKAKDAYESFASEHHHLSTANLMSYSKS
jgi:hypothetical protein